MCLPATLAAMVRLSLCYYVHVLPFSIALAKDLSINALYYDLTNDVVIDPCGTGTSRRM